LSNRQAHEKSLAAVPQADKACHDGRLRHDQEACMNRFSLTILLLLLTAIWGWTFPMVKDAVAEYGVLSFLAVRFVISALVLAPLGARSLTWSTVRLGGAIGLVLSAAYLLQTFGVHYTTATNCGLITGLFVIFAIVLNRVVFHVYVGRLVKSAVAVSLAGLLLLTGTGPTPPNWGDGLTLAAAACYGLQIVLLDRYAKRHVATALALVQVITAAAVFVLVWAAMGLSGCAAPRLAWPSSQVWLALLITSVLATAFGFYVQTLVQQHLPAVRTAMIFTLEPVFAAVFGYLLAGDRLTGLQMVGAALMVAAAMASEVGQAYWASRVSG
jgi:drug/metabolite transporter (DMT)-like permease